jgi:hypothetical protein
MKLFSMKKLFSDQWNCFQWKSFFLFN